MKVDRPASVCSDDDCPLVPEYIANDNSPVSSPELVMPPDPYNEPIYSPFEPVNINLIPSPEYNMPPSPAYSTESYSPFDYTQNYGHFAVVQPTIDFERQAEFIRAIQDGSSKEVRRLVSKYSQSLQVDGFTSDGQTALTQSCLKGNLEVVKILISHGASIHLPNRDGFSPLHIACWCGKLDVMQFLLGIVPSTQEQ